MSLSSGCWASGLAVGLVLTPASAFPQSDSTPAVGAGSSSEIDWRHRRQSPLDYVATGAAAAGTVTLELAIDSDVPRTVGTNGFDDAFRNAFVLGSFDARRVAARASDVGLVALLVHRVVVDDLFVAALGHGDGDAAWQMTAIDAQALSFTLLATDVTKRAFERERPSARFCRTDPDYDRRCEDQGRGRGFFSGHTSVAFATASLTCVHHAFVPLYGGDADTVACVAAQMAAVHVGFERILADRHYMTDVLAGAAVGIGFGGLLPLASVYLHETRGQTVSLAPLSVPGGAGLTANGVF